jgi:hypothetical protein
LSDIASIIIRALVGLFGGIIGIFCVLRWSERRTSQTSQAGAARLDREARSWQRRVLGSWKSLALALLVASSLIGGAIWWF